MDEMWKYPDQAASAFADLGPLPQVTESDVQWVSMRDSHG
jgi:hypothetical protein